MRSARRFGAAPSSSSPTLRSRPTRQPARMCFCPRLAGAKRTARSQTPSGASHASAHSCRRPARRAPTGGRWRKWASALASQPHFPTGTQRRFSRNMPGFRPSGTRDRALSTSAHIRTSRSRSMKNSNPFSGPNLRANRPRQQGCLAKADFSPLTERGASFQRPGAPRLQKRRAPFRSCSTLAGYAINGIP